jgi:peroxiredoxin/mono/diheme cytochrome c family protein
MFRILICAIVFVSAAFAQAADSPESVIGSKLPNVALTGLDGKAVALETVLGRSATVIVFASFECPLSNSYATQLNELAKDLAAQGVKVVLVCPTTESPEAVAKAAETAFKPVMPVLLDPKKELATGLKAVVTPEVFVLDAQRVVRYRGRIDDAWSARLKRNPVVSSQDLQAALTAVLEGKAVAKPVTTAVGCAIVYQETPSPKTGAVTFYRDVQPILNNNCVVCHRAGEVGPFALTTYAQARRWGSDIKEYTSTRQMPPWMPAGGVRMKDERKLTDKEIATLAAWVDSGMPEGDPKDAPKPPEFHDGWRMGKPDIIITPSEDFRLAATGDDLFRVFVIPTGLTENVWVRGYDVKPGNPRIVHHTLHYFDTTGQGRSLEKKQLAKDQEETAKGNPPADRGPGYTAGMGVGFVARGGTREAPAFGGIGGWAPGLAPQFLPPGHGWLLPKGSDFLIHTHYHRNGLPGTDRTQVGLYLAKGPVEQPWQTIVVNGMKPTERIPAGKPDHVARGHFYLHTDAVIHNVLPHMHQIGKSVKMTLTPPQGKPIVLVDIPAWDYKWQETYWFQEPITAKAGSKIEIEAVFDNSADNPNNPNRPPVYVSVGERTNDEMLFGFLGVTSTKTPWERVRTSSFPPPGVAMEPPVRGQLTPELERRLGEWQAVITIKPRGGAETQVKNTERVTKTFDGTYLLIHTRGDGDGNDTYELATFDPERKCYRMWTYTHEGAIIEWEGKWDNASQSFTWSAPISGELKGTLIINCGDPNAHTRDFKIKVGFVTGYSATGTLNRKQ